MNIQEVEVPQTKSTQETRLQSLGFSAAATRLRTLKEKKRKMAIAYEHYRFVRPENIAAFNRALYDKTRSDSAGYKTLVFDPIADYQEFPPESVLASLDTAIERKCFDSFEVAHIRRVKDPILFGRINECPDRFFIDQWDDDCKIEDILKANEG